MISTLRTTGGTTFGNGVLGNSALAGTGLSGTGPKTGGRNYLRGFALERVRTTDLTASGGDAALLAAAADEDEPSA